MGESGVHPDRRIQLRVNGGHDGGHCAAGGHPGDVDPIFVDGKVSDDVGGDAGNDGRFAGACLLVTIAVSVPGAGRVGRPGLGWAADQERVLVGLFVHGGVW